MEETMNTQERLSNLYKEHIQEQSGQMWVTKEDKDGLPLEWSFYPQGTGPSTEFLWSFPASERFAIDVQVFDQSIEYDEERDIYCTRTGIPIGDHDDAVNYVLEGDLSVYLDEFKFHLMTHRTAQCCPICEELDVNCICSEE
jgi:hypothetical protein